MSPVDSKAFEKHISDFHSSDAYKKKEAEAKPFFDGVKDFVFGRPTTLENMVCDPIYLSRDQLLTSSCSGT